MRLISTIFFLSSLVLGAQTPAPAPTPTPAPATTETVLPAVPKTVPMTLVLPTDNDALLRGKPEEFYMWVDRSFENQQTKPWEGGQYGFVRGPVRVGSQVVLMHFHEGIDIACIKRSEKGEPEDQVRSISDGEVVHCSDIPGASNYGRYLVIKHDWGEGPFYSLYAHLSRIDVREGDKVQPGTPVAVMGHTGEGINVQRSHTHLELNLMLNTHYGEWHDGNLAGEPNRHGAYHGYNLAGMDIAALYLERQKNPALTVVQFLKTQTVTWKAIVPRRAEIELAQTYPWMGENLQAPSPSWEISFTDGGVPLKITPSSEACTGPKLSWVKDNGVPHAYYTKSCVNGSGPTGALTATGVHYLQLITGDCTPDPSAPKSASASKKSTKKKK
jgi:hypothetical protein